MTPEQLVDRLAEMADLWEQAAEERRDAVVEVVIAALLLEPDLSRVNLREVLAAALLAANYPDVGIEDRLNEMRSVYPYVGLSANERALVTSTLDKRLDEAAARVEAALLATLLNGGDEPDQFETIRTATDTAVSGLTGHVSSLLTVMDRVALTGQVDDVYAYTGPADSRNRPFCGRIVRQKTLYTKVGIESLNSHPLLNSDVPPNVFSRCGGYKCRHIWLPVSADTREALQATGWTVQDGEEV